MSRTHKVLVPESHITNSTNTSVGYLTFDFLVNKTFEIIKTPLKDQ